MNYDAASYPDPKPRATSIDAVRAEFGTLLEGQSMRADTAEHAAPAAVAEADLPALLAQLGELAYAQRRPLLAKAAGVGVTALDRVRDEARKAARGARSQARTEPAPWPVPVNGDSLLDGFVTALRRFIVADAWLLDVVALWIVAAWVLDAFNVFPMLLITAPTRECGKTRLLDVIARLAPNPMPSGSATPAVLYRSTEQRPTILLDEIDRWIEKDDELIAFLNNGWQPNIPFRRCAGDDHHIEEFACWCPKALAMIGMPQFANADALVSRSLVLQMRRKLPGDAVERFRHRRAYHELAELGRMAARWTTDHLEKLRGFEIGENDLASLDGREVDNWEVLAAVAYFAGGAWPQRLRNAIPGLRHEDEDLSIELLRDLRPLIEKQPAISIHTETILSHLVALDDRPWGRIRKGDKPVDGDWLRRRLKRFEIKPEPRAFEIDGRELRGYQLEPLHEAFERYLGPTDPEKVSDVSEVSANEPGGLSSGGNGPDPDTSDTSDTSPDGVGRGYRVAPLAPGPLRDEWLELAGKLESDGLERADAEHLAAERLGLLVADRVQ